MSRNALPYYKRYPRDLIEGTIGMPFEEKVTYAFILDLIYLQNGKLPDDSRYIAGMLGIGVRKWGKLRASLIKQRKLQVTGRLLTNFRASKELETLGKYQDSQAQNRAGSSKNKDLQKPTLNDGSTSARLYTESDANGRGREGSGAENLPEKIEKPPAKVSIPTTPDMTERERLIVAMGYKPENGYALTASGKMIGTMADMREYQQWREDLGLTWNEVLTTMQEVMASRRDPEPPTMFKYFTSAMRRTAADKKRETMKPAEGTKNVTRSQQNQRSDDAAREAIERVRSGQIQLGSGRRDPFA